MDLAASAKPRRDEVNRVADALGFTRPPFAEHGRHLQTYAVRRRRTRRQVGPVHLIRRFILRLTVVRLIMLLGVTTAAATVGGHFVAKVLEYRAAPPKTKNRQDRRPGLESAQSAVASKASLSSPLPSGTS